MHSIFFGVNIIGIIIFGSPIFDAGFYSKKIATEHTSIYISFDEYAANRAESKPQFIRFAIIEFYTLIHHEKIEQE